MIKASDSDTYEGARSLEQDLTFHAAEAVFERYGAALSAQNYRAPGITDVKKTREYLLARQMHENGLIEIAGRGTDKKVQVKVREDIRIWLSAKTLKLYITMANRTAFVLSAVVCPQ